VDVRAVTDETFSVITESLDAPMVIVTAGVREERAGCLVGFHAQVSIDPMRYAVWLSKANHTYRVALLARHVAVHFLDRDDHDLAELFGTRSGDDVDKFAECEWEPSDEGPPLLSRCPNRMLLRRTGLLDEGGDHVCFIGEPVEVRSVGRFAPLRLSDVADLVAGHTVDERPIPPTERAVGSTRDRG
jgi:flavin reductase (DIM6/NTAB) family NADH-FMN oxidoreductase RutF